MAAAASPEDERFIAERVARGDAAAEHELVLQFRDRIYSLCVARTRDAELSRDLVQDVLIEVLRSVRSGQLRDSDHLAAFIYGVARNVINNNARHAAKRCEEPIDLHEELRAATQDTAAADRLALVQRALEKLDRVDRQILLLTLVDGRKPGEIAALLGLSPEAVRARKSRALKKLVLQVHALSRK